MQKEHIRSEDFLLTNYTVCYLYGGLIWLMFFPNIKVLIVIEICVSGWYLARIVMDVTALSQHTFLYHTYALYVNNSHSYGVVLYTNWLTSRLYCTSLTV